MKVSSSHHHQHWQLCLNVRWCIRLDLQSAGGYHSTGLPMWWVSPLIDRHRVTDRATRNPNTSSDYSSSMLRNICGNKMAFSPSVLLWQIKLHPDCSKAAGVLLRHTLIIPPSVCSETTSAANLPQMSSISSSEWKSPSLMLSINNTLFKFKYVKAVLNKQLKGRPLEISFHPS